MTLSDHGYSFPRQEQVDPFPCYAHDLTVTRESMKQVADAFPMDWPVTVYVMSHEGLGRTNALAYTSDEDHNSKDDRGLFTKRYPYIVFNGKRTAILPAVTRYLCAHEYGHIVEQWVEFKQGKKFGVLLDEYAKLRGIETPKNYGGGTWHASPGEVFANDFRLIFTGEAKDFWPHPVLEPQHSPAVMEWWEEAAATCGVAFFPRVS